MYYVPLMLPKKQALRNPTSLPLRKHGDWTCIMSRIASASTKKEKKEIVMNSGIKGMPVLLHVGSLDYARRIPWDFMHLLFQNVVKNLVHLWMGKFKNLDAGSGDFVIPEHIWKEIGIETVAVTRDIPAAFVGTLGNLAGDQTTYTAETWAFWFMYITPILLIGHLSKRYYNHFSLLVNIIKKCIQYSITIDELNELHDNIVKWVKEYERYAIPI